MSNFAVGSTFHTTNKGETTEWEDVLVRKGIIKSREEAAGVAQQDRIVEELIEKAQSQEKATDPLASKTLADLDDLVVGDEIDGGDESEQEAADGNEDSWASDEQDARKFLDAYRQKRMAEMKREAKAAKFGGEWAVPRRCCCCGYGYFCYQAVFVVAADFEA